ncbi:LPXTG cell wall anchor domain-containing protein [Kitasatospora sp. NPDC057904]|uniref:LPXTG cell wall anchor domain-containing protein n=1 Tax=Kitasatospora sp. NPDC057904 TaxID=3346275 RepID=UPI0036D86BAA
MRTSVITHFAKNTRSLSTRRTLATLATTAVLAGGIQILTTDTAWACSGPYQGPGTTISADARARHHANPLDADIIEPNPTSLTAGSSIEFGVKLLNLSGADYDNAAFGLTLKDDSGANRLRTGDATIEAMINGTWTKLGIDDGCGGEAVRVDTGSLGQHLADGRTARVMFRLHLAASAPKDLTMLSVTASPWAEAGPASKPVGVGIRVLHANGEAKPAGKPTVTAKPSAPAKPAPGKPAADETKTAAPAAPAAEAPKSPVVAPTSAPATTAPDGATELAHTGSSSTNGFLALSAAALLALGAGVLIAVRRLRPQR